MELINADGSERTPFLPEAPNFISLSSCGDRYVVFDYYKGKYQLWRADADGTNPIELAENVAVSTCSPDGTWVLYSYGNALYRIGINGGPTKELVRTHAPAWVAISPDGEWIAYGYQEWEPVPQEKVGVVPAEGGPAKQTFSVPAGAKGLHWSPDGKGVQYLLTRKGATNVWEQELAGGEPRQVTTFTSGQIFDFSWSRDGKTLLLAKGEITRDAVLISNVR
jgi:Tol biopolymer transport system component